MRRGLGSSNGGVLSLPADSVVYFGKTCQLNSSLSDWRIERYPPFNNSCGLTAKMESLRWLVVFNWWVKCCNKNRCCCSYCSSFLLLSLLSFLLSAFFVLFYVLNIAITDTTKKFYYLSISERRSPISAICFDTFPDRGSFISTDSISSMPVK